MLVILKHIQVHCYSRTFLLYYFTHLQIHMYQEMANVSHIETYSGELVLMNLYYMLIYTSTESYVPQNGKISHFQTCLGALLLLNLYSILFYTPTDSYVPLNAQCWLFSGMYRCIGILEPLFYTILYT